MIKGIAVTFLSATMLATCVGIAAKPKGHTTASDVRVSDLRRKFREDPIQIGMSWSYIRDEYHLDIDGWKANEGYYTTSFTYDGWRMCILHFQDGMLYSVYGCN